MRDNLCVEDSDPIVIWYLRDTSQGRTGAPVLADQDLEFSCRDQNGPVKIKISSRFRKVICSLKACKLQAFPFILAQEVADPPLEFHVTAEWKHSLVSLKKLEEMI